MLNYKDELSALALRELQDCQNHVGMDGASSVPPGLSQTSYFGEEDEGLAKFITNTTEFDETDKFHSSEILKSNSIARKYSKVYSMIPQKPLITPT